MNQEEKRLIRNINFHDTSQDYEKYKKINAGKRKKFALTVCNDAIIDEKERNGVE